MISVIRIYLLLANCSNDSGPGVTMNTSKKNVNGKFSILSLVPNFSGTFRAHSV